MTTLWPHQQKAFDFAVNRPATLVAAGMGTGKSAIAIALADHWQPRRTLILCPTTVRPVWRREIGKHCQRDVAVAILDRGSVAKRTEQAVAAWDDDRPSIVVANYEMVLHQPFRNWALRYWDLVVLDESHRIQGQKRTALYCAALNVAGPHRLCLTGTPLTQDPLSIWAQCRFLDPNVFGDYLHRFLDWFEAPVAVSLYKKTIKRNRDRAIRGLPPITLGGWAQEGVVNMPLYLRLLSQLAIRIENAVLNLPPLTTERRTFRLSDRARRLYAGIARGHHESVERGLWPEVRGSYAITMRLQQITSGWLPNREGEIVEVDHGKADCLADILDGASGEPVVVFCRFVRDLDTTATLAAKMGLRYGEISHRRKDGMNDLATMPEGLQVVGVQEQAGGAGIDLTRARIGVDFSPSWSLANREQKIARIHRPPATRPAIIYELVAEDTIDEQIYLALAARRQIIGRTWKLLETVA